MDAFAQPGTLRDSSTTTLLWRHLAHFLPLLLLTTAAFALAVQRTRSGTPLSLGLIYGLVVALNMLAIAMSTWSTVLGTIVTVLRGSGIELGGLTLAPATGSARTAILMPICEEDAARVFAAARVMADNLAALPVGEVDLFVLSDSHSDRAVSDETTMQARVASSGDRPSIFYRNRTRSTGRKAGNIADFVTRWGAAYEFMIVLDADSLMTGEAMARLIGAMEANPRVGLIQAMCFPVGRQSLFARLQHFNARLYGPLFQRGVAFWQGPRGNFWGHNAILRTAPFAANCGLPVLPGPPPLGGEILSHDTVEAALMLRGGYDVWMLPDDPVRGNDGSWEETPANLIDHLERDRRWCRGNLQHMKVLRASGLKLASLYHLSRGLLHYFYAPLAVLWLVLFAAVDRRVQWDALALLVAATIAAPRLLCLGVALAQPRLVRGFGGRAAVVVSACLDQGVTALMYPVTLVFHLVVIATTLIGGEASWAAQVRDDRSLLWRDVARCYVAPLGTALVALILLASVVPAPAVFLMAGLIAAIPLTVVSSRSTGTFDGLFRTPEDAASRPLRTEVARLEALLRSGDRLDRGAVTPILPEDARLAMHASRLR